MLCAVFAKVLLFAEAEGSRAAFAVQGSGTTGQLHKARRAVVLDSSTAEVHYWPVWPCESKASQEDQARMSLAPSDDCQSQRKRKTKCKVDSF